MERKPMTDATHFIEVIHDGKFDERFMKVYNEPISKILRMKYHLYCTENAKHLKTFVVWLIKPKKNATDSI